MLQMSDAISAAVC